MMEERRPLSCGGSTDVGRWLSLAVLASVVVVPMVFSVALEDTFGLPKLLALWVVLILACALAVMARRWDALVVVPSVDSAVAVLVAVHALALVVSVDRGLSLWGERLQHQGVATLVLYVGFFYLARLVLGGLVGLATLYRAVTAGAVVVAVFGVVQWLGWDPIWSELPNGRVFSTLGQPNALGAYLAAAVPLAVVVIYLARTRWGRVVGWLGMGLLVVVLVLSMSRGAYFGLAVATAVIATALVRRRDRVVVLRRGGGPMGAAVVAVSLVLVGVVGPARDTAESIVRRVAASGQVGVPGSVQMHLDLWRVAAAITVDRPVLGAGPDAFAVMFPEYRDEVLPVERAAPFVPFRVESPHNVYLALASGAGVLALVAYLWLIVAVIGRAVRWARPQEDRAWFVVAGGVAALAAHLVTDVFMTADVTGTWLFWVLGGALVATSTTHIGSQPARAGRSAA